MYGEFGKTVMTKEQLRREFNRVDMDESKAIDKMEFTEFLKKYMQRVANSRGNIMCI